MTSNIQNNQVNVTQNNGLTPNQGSSTDEKTKKRVRKELESQTQNNLEPSTYSESGRPKKQQKLYHQPIEDIDPFFETNKKVIISFPSDDEDAQIKEDPAEGGILGMIDKSTSYPEWIRFRHYGSQLPRTVEVMKKTLQTAHQKFDNTYLQVIEKTLLDDTLLLPMLLDMEIQLSQGLLNIKNTYFHENDDTHDGLTKLQQFNNKTITKINEHKGQLTKISPDIYNMIFSEKENSVLNIENSSHNLKAYCTRYCELHFSRAQAINKILSGQKLLKAIFSANGAQPSTDAQEACNAVTNITWFLMYYALKQQQGFFEGSFIIENSDKLFDFMKGLPSCKERVSSHLQNRPTPTSYEVSGEANYMPAKKKVVLFAMVSPFSSIEKVLFFKPENDGATTTTTDLARHTIGFAGAQIIKVVKPGSDDLPGMQKERVPCNAEQIYKELTTHLQNNLELYRPTLNQMLITDLNSSLPAAQLWGIAYMHAFVTKFLNIHKLELPPELDKLINRLQDTWESFDNLESRTGREVYINKQQLQEFLDSTLNFSEGNEQFAQKNTSMTLDI